MSKSYRAGDTVEDVCRSCKTDRLHTVVAADNGRPLRVVCDYCRSEHNFRGGPRLDGRQRAPRLHWHDHGARSRPRAPSPFRWSS